MHRSQGKRLPGIYTYPCHLYSWEQDSTLWPDICKYINLIFQAFVKVCWSYRMILLTLKYKSLMCSACRTSFCLYELVINKCLAIKLGIAALSHDYTLGCNATDNHSVAPGYLWQNLQSRYFLNFITSHSRIWQETSNPVTLPRLGTEKVAQSWCTRFRMRNCLKVKVH